MGIDQAVLEVCWCTSDRGNKASERNSGNLTPVRWLKNPWWSNTSKVVEFHGVRRGWRPNATAIHERRKHVYFPATRRRHRPNELEATVQKINNLRCDVFEWKNTPEVKKIPLEFCFVSRGHAYHSLVNGRLADPGPRNIDGT